MRIGVYATKKGIRPYASVSVSTTQRKQQLSQGKAIAYLIMFALAVTIAYLIMFALAITVTWWLIQVIS